MVETPTAHIDLAPTVLDLLNLRPLEQGRGVSLAPIIREDGEASDLAARLIGFETYPGARKKFWRIFAPRLRRVPIRIGFRAGRFKFIYDVRKEEAQLFDLASDDGSTNLIERFPDLRRAGGEMVRYISSSAAPSGDAKIDPEDMDRLRSLGYVQ